MGAIAGNITTSEGEPIADASVLVESGPSHPDLAAITDASGAYRLSDLNPGQYVVRVFAEGFLTMSGRVPVRDKQVTSLNVTLEEDESPVPEMDDQFKDVFPTPSKSGSEEATPAPPSQPPRRRLKNLG